jgi:hypothetical protein
VNYKLDCKSKELLQGILELGLPGAFIICHCTVCFFFFQFVCISGFL